MEEALTKALAKQPRTIDYPEYETTDDFSRWLAGYQAKVQDAYGFDPGQVDEIKAQVVRSISSKLSVGSALDSYNRLEPTDKTDYGRLVSCLTEEFVDQHEKCRFNENISYNVRKRGQTLKDFMEEIKKDLGRYSDLPDTRYDSTGTPSPNPEKEKEGVCRFRAGMRNMEGKKDKELRRHLKYHMMASSELTWGNALKVASSWEIACGSDSSVEKKKETEKEAEDEESLNAVGKEVEEEVSSTASLLDQVHENRRRIEKLESAQEEMAASLEAIGESQNAMNAILLELSSKMDVMFSWVEPCGGDGLGGGWAEAESSGVGAHAPN